MSYAHGLQPGQPLINVSNLEVASAVIAKDEHVGLAVSEGSIELAQRHSRFAHVALPSQCPVKNSESKTTTNKKTRKPRGKNKSWVGQNDDAALDC